MGLGVTDQVGDPRLGLAELFEENSTTNVTDTGQSKVINLLEVKQIGITTLQTAGSTSTMRS